MNFATTVRFLPILALFGLLAAAVPMGLAGCSTPPSEEEEAQREAENAAMIRSLSQKSATRAQWRQETMPELLRYFGTDNAGDRAEARRALLASEHTPAQRSRDEGSEEVVTTPGSIRDRLEQESWDSTETRAWLVHEGEVYEQLAKFSSDERDDWADARETLEAMGFEEAQRAAFELVLRLLWTPEEQEAVAMSGGGRLTGGTARRPEYDTLEYARRMSSGPRQQVSEDQSVWAIQELVALELSAVEPLIWGSKLTYMMSGPDAARFREKIYYTLGEIGPVALEPLAIEATNSLTIEDDEAKYQRITRIIRTIESIMRNARTRSHRTYLASLSRLDRERQLAVDALTTVLNTYIPANEYRHFALRNYAINAFEAIALPDAVPTLVDLWQAGQAEEDEMLIEEVQDALQSITGRSLATYDAWRAYVDGSDEFSR